MNRFLGITFFACLNILGGISMIALCFSHLTVSFTISIYWLIQGVVYLVVGKGLLGLKKWSRGAEILLSIFSILLVIINVIQYTKNWHDLLVIKSLNIVLSLVAIYYFTHSKVREQFNWEFRGVPGHET